MEIMNKLSLEEKRSENAKCSKWKKTDLGNPTMPDSRLDFILVVLKLEKSESPGRPLKRDCWLPSPESLIQKVWSGA